MAATAQIETPGVTAVLPSEDRSEFQQLLAHYTTEYRPVTPTERFLVTELAQAQWRIMRATAIEAELLTSGPAEAFRTDELTRLDRYAQSARRAYYKAHQTLESIRRGRTREATRDFERRLHAYMEAPPPGGVKLALVHEPPPMPVHLQRELDSHRRRDPDFDPRMDASQMSKELQQWFRKRAAAA